MGRSCPTPNSVRAFPVLLTQDSSSGESSGCSWNFLGIVSHAGCEGMRGEAWDHLKDHPNLPTNLTFSHTQLVHRSHQATSSRWTPGNALVVHRLSSSLAFQRAAGSLVPRCTEGVEVMNRPALCQDKCSYHRYVLKYICIYVYIYKYIYLQSVYCSMHSKKKLALYKSTIGWLVG